jgi:GNAT superfamily N-acetyltransferase
MVTIRPATMADSRGIAGVHVRSWREAYAGIMPDPVLAGLDPDARTRGHASRIATAPENGWTTEVAVTGDEVVGFVQCGPYRLDRRTVEPGVAEVFAIYVDPTVLGTGVGAALMSTALRWVAGRGYAEVRLWVLRDNARARAFYDRRGFAPDGHTHVYGIGGVDLPEVRYARTVPPAR